MTTEIPLIWTTKGNLPIADLEYKTEWFDHPEYMTFSEKYFLGEELVKSSVHVYSKIGMALGGVAQQF
jgi:hypothetical protein